MNSLSENGGAANQVKTGATAFSNLYDAINGNGASPSTEYTAGTVKNNSVTAYEHDGPTSSGFIFLSANTPGWAGNNIQTGVSSSDLYIGPFVSGVDATKATDTITFANQPTAGDTVTIGSQVYTFQTGAETGEGQVQIGSSLASTVSHLVSAIGGNDIYGDHLWTPNSSALESSYSGGTSFSVQAVTAGSAGNGINVSANVTGSGGGSTGTWSAGSTQGGANGTTSSGTDLSNTTDAKAALLAVTNAISLVAQMRGTLGANMNELQATTNVLNTQVQNLTSAESGITSANMAGVVANMTMDNILMSTSMASLQQANQQSQSILKLLQ